jgi:hypothetical protein
MVKDRANWGGGGYFEHGNEPSTLLKCGIFFLTCMNVYWTTATGISGLFSTALTEVFPCFFLNCKANARV